MDARHGLRVPRTAGQDPRAVLTRFGRPGSHSGAGGTSRGDWRILVKAPGYDLWAGYPEASTILSLTHGLQGKRQPAHPAVLQGREADQQM